MGRQAAGGSEHARRTLERYLAQRGLKSTRQRDSIVELFLAQTGHVGVDELLERARAEDAHVSPATVYRTMKLLVDCGLAQPRQFGDGLTRYERAEGREHLICSRCRMIVEFEEPRIEALQDAVARRHGFAVTDHKLELYGLCAKCRAEQDEQRPARRPRRGAA
jgi:Fur family ferric uptake transcriptional regulator